MAVDCDRAGPSLKLGFQPERECIGLGDQRGPGQCAGAAPNGGALGAERRPVVNTIQKVEGMVHGWEGAS